MPTGLCGESSCEGPWLSSSAGTAPGSSISRCTAAPSRCGRPPFPPDRERDGVRPRPPQSSAVRPQSRPVAPRQRLAVRGRAGHLPPAPGAARGAGRRGDPDPADDRIHAGAGEPACEPRLRRRTGGVLRAAAGCLRRSAPGAAGVRRWVARATRRLLAVAAHPSAGAVPENRRRSRLRLSPPPGAGSPRDHRLRRHARLPAAARSGRKHSAAARGGPAGAPAPVRRRPGGMLAAGVRLSPARQVAWEKGAARHRAAPRGRGVSLLLHRRPSRARGQPARRLRRDSARRGAIRRGAARSGVHDGSSSAGRALALSGLPGLRSRCTPRGRGAGARPPLFHADLEPTPGLPRRRVVPRVSQDPLARRLEALARQRRERGSGRQTFVRAVGGARAGHGACLPLRSSPPEPGAAAGRPARGRHHRGAIRYGAVRALVVEGADFLAATYRALRGSGKDGVRAVTASQHLEAHAASTALQLAEGSWGANGDHSMWLNDQTAWTWERLWRLEDAFWDAAPAGLASPAAHPVLAQAARELLLAQASDWQFIISTGAVVDYAERRFTLHCDDAERLIKALSGGDLEGGGRLGDELARRDDLFPDVLAAVTRALGR